jgi:hypothetical protein
MRCYNPNFRYFLHRDGRWYARLVDFYGRRDVSRLVGSVVVF